MESILPSTAGPTISLRWFSGTTFYDGERLRSCPSGNGLVAIELGPKEAAICALRLAREKTGNSDYQIIAEDRQDTRTAGGLVVKAYAVAAWKDVYRYLEEGQNLAARHAYAMVLDDENVHGFPLLIDIDIKAYKGTRKAFVEAVLRLFSVIRERTGVPHARFIVDDACSTAMDKQSVHIVCRDIGFTTIAAARTFNDTLRQATDSAGQWVDPAVPSHHGCFKFVACTKLGNRRAQRPWVNDAPFDMPPLTTRERYSAIVNVEQFFERRPWFNAQEVASGRIKFLDQAPSPTALAPRLLRREGWPFQKYVDYYRREMPWEKLPPWLVGAFVTEGFTPLSPTPIVIERASSARYMRTLLDYNIQKGFPLAIECTIQNGRVLFLRVEGTNAMPLSLAAAFVQLEIDRSVVFSASGSSTLYVWSALTTPRLAGCFAHRDTRERLCVMVNSQLPAGVRCFVPRSVPLPFSLDRITSAPWRPNNEDDWAKLCSSLTPQK